MFSQDVRTFKHEDRMDSYFLAEMFKYLYLLFTPSDYPLGIDIDDYVLTTEAHILPLKLSLKTVFNGNFSFDQVRRVTCKPLMFRLKLSLNFKHF